MSSTMFYGAFCKHGKKPEAYIYTDWQRWHTDTFSPDTDIIAVLPFCVHGANYRSRKESARDLAIRWQHADAECSGGGMSYGEYSIIGDFFAKIGKKYGLLREFRESCIPC